MNYVATEVKDANVFTLMLCKKGVYVCVLRHYDVRAGVKWELKLFPSEGSL